jgi:hypothetical protein
MRWTALSHLTARVYVKEISYKLLYFSDVLICQPTVRDNSFVIVCTLYQHFIRNFIFIIGSKISINFSEL